MRIQNPSKSAARKIGFLFQDQALFPHLTLEQNIAFGLKSMNVAARKRLVSDTIDRFHLHGLESRLPHQISGGQQQRVALAGSLVRRPGLLFLDEPLSALDTGLREGLRCQLRQMLSDFGIPVIVVTHDFREAAALGDRIAVMHAGRMLQQGTVEEVYSRPRDAIVARIPGFETIVPGEVIGEENGMVIVRIGEVKLIAAATVLERETARTKLTLNRCGHRLEPVWFPVPFPKRTVATCSWSQPSRETGVRFNGPVRHAHAG